jgi:hypothetical protein
MTLLALVALRPSAAALVAASYVAVGLGVGAWHLRAGRRAQAWTALVAWPLLTGGGAASPRGGQGPMAGRIEAAIGGLRTALADPAAGGLVADDDLGPLRLALLELDGRVGLADRLLADAGDGAGRAALEAARARSAADIDGALAELSALRLQVGVLALGGDAGAVTGRLRELRHRLAAEEELMGHDRT